MTQQEMSEMLIRIDERTERTDKILCGNGQPGLIQKHEALDDRVLQIEISRKTWAIVLGTFVTIFTLVNGFCATYIAFLAFYNK
jgi:hypothetical protein